MSDRFADAVGSDHHNASGGHDGQQKPHRKNDKSHGRQRSIDFAGFDVVFGVRCSVFVALSLVS